MLTPTQRVRRSIPLRAMTWLMALYLLLGPVLPVLAMPRGAQVVSGDVGYTRNGNSVVVYQGTDRAIVNYEGFDILSGESVQFVQPGSSAAILNRVIGGDASEIAGALLANGRVFLINPNGILFSQSANVDVGGLVASALNMSDSDFLSGRLAFAGGGGDVVNQGSLSGGFVYLLGGSVANSGSINASDVIMAAGGSVLIDKVAGGEVRLVIDGVEMDPAGLTNAAPAVDLGAEEIGTDASAPAATEQEQSVVLAQLAAALLEAGAPEGASGTVINEGVINVSGAQGGTVQAYGTLVGQFGDIHADGTLGGGGSIDLHASDAIVVGAESETTANAGLFGNGGTILIVGERSATVATGAKIAARGGALGGNGGLVETSGHEHFRIGAVPDVSAPAGGAGTWLIDPSNITITNGLLDIQISTNSPFLPLGEVADSVLSVFWVRAALTNGANVVIATTSTNLADGNVTWLAEADLDYTLSGTNTLTVLANNNLIIEADITDSETLLTTDQLGLTLRADADGSGAGNVTVTGNIELNGGDFVATGANFANSGNGEIRTGGGALNITVTNAIVLGADLSAGVGATALIAGGSITDDGNNGTTIAGGTVTLTAGSDIGAAGANGQIDTDAGTLHAAAGGDIHIGDAGSVNLGSIVAGGDATLTAVVDLLDDGNNATTISGGTVSLSAGGDVGAGGATGQIDTDADRLNASAGVGGDIRIGEADAVTLDTLTANGAIVVSNMTGNLTVGTVTAGANVTLTAAGALVDDLNNATRVTGNTITLAALNGDLGAPGPTGQVDVAADTLNASTGGSLWIEELDDATLNFVSAGTNATVTAGGDLTVITVGAPGIVRLTAASDILDDGNNGTWIDSGSVRLVAGGNIGAAGANAEVDTDAGQVGLVAGTNIFLRDVGLSAFVTNAQAGGTISLISAGTLTTGPITAGGRVSLFTGGALLQTNGVISTPELVVRSFGAVRGEASTTDPLDINTPLVMVTNLAAGSILLANQRTGSVSLSGLETLDGSIVYTQALGTVTVLAPIENKDNANGQNDAIVVTTSGGITLRANVINGDELQNIGTAGVDGPGSDDIANTNLIGVTYAGGDVFSFERRINGGNAAKTYSVRLDGGESPTIIATHLTNASFAFGSAGDILIVGGSLTATNGNITLLADVDNSGEGGIGITNGSLTSAGDIYLEGSFLSAQPGLNRSIAIDGASFLRATGSVTMVAGPGAAAHTDLQDIYLNAKITAHTGVVSIVSEGDVIIDRLGNIDPVAVVITAGLDIVINGSITATDLIDLTATNAIAQGANSSALMTDQLLFQAGTDVSLGSTSNLFNTVSGTAGGSITLVDSVALSVDASGPHAGLTAGQNVAVTTPDLDLNAAINAGGNVALTADVMTLEPGSTTVAGGTVTLSTLTTTRDVELGTADPALAMGLSQAELDTITAQQIAVRGSNILVTADIAPTGASALTLTAAGAITDPGNFVITENAVSMTAGSGIQAELATRFINAATTNGNVTVNNVNAAATSVGTARTGGGDVLLTQAGGGSLTVSNAAASGTITIDVGDGAALTAGAVVAGGTATLSADGAILDDGNNATRVAGTTVSLTAGTSIGAAGATGQLETQADTLTAAATSGSVHLGETDAATLTSITAGGDIVVTNSAGDLTVATVTAGGNATLGAGGSIVDDDNNATRITGATVNLTAGGAIGAAGLTGQMDTAADTLNATAATGDVHVAELDGVTLGTVAAGAANNVNLTAGGAILDDGNNATRVSGATVNLSAGGAIGAAGATGQIDTDAGTINATALGGDLHIGEANAVTLTTAAALGNVVVTNSTGDMTVGTVFSATGDATLAAGGSMLDDGDNATRVTGGTVTLRAGGAIGAAGATEQMETTAATLNAAAGTGDVHIGETDALTVASATAGGSVVITNSAGDLTVGTVTAGIDATLGAVGSILDDGNNATRVAGSTVTLTAGGTVGAAGATAQIDTAAIALAATAGAGDVHVGELNDMTLQTAIASGNVVVTSGADMVVGTVTAGGDVTLASTGGSLGDDNDNATRIAGGTVNLSAAGAIGFTGALAQMDTDADTLNASAAAGGVFIGETDGVALGTITSVNDDIVVTNGAGDMLVGTVTATGADVLLGTGGNLVDDGNNATRVTGGTVTLSAAGAIGAAGVTAQIDTSAQTLNAAAGGGNSIFVDETDSVVLGAVTSSGDVTLTAGGSILDDNNNGTAVAAVNLNLTAGGAIGAAGATGQLDTEVTTLTASAADGGLHVGEADGLTVPSATATGDLSITNSSGDLTVATITAGGNATLAAGGNLVDDNNNATRITGATVTLAAGGNIGAAGATAQMDTTAETLNATAGAAGSVFVDETDTVALGTVAAGGDVTISAGGSILDDGDNSTSVGGATVNLTAGGAVGAAGATGQLETDATTLNVAAANGGISIGEADAVTLNSMTATGDIVVTNSAGNMTVNTVTTGGNVALTAAGDLLDDNNNATRITGTTINLGAGGTIGAAGATAQLDTTVATLNAAAVAGDVHIGETDAITLGTVTASGDIVITNSAGDMTAGTVTAGGALTLAAAGALLDDLNNGTRVTGDLLTLTAGTSIGAAGETGQLETDGGPTLVLTAPVSIFINELDTVTLGNVVAGVNLVVTNSFGDMTVGTVSAGSQIGLGAAGNLLDDGDNATRLTAPTVSLIAGNSVGASGANGQMDTTAATLNGNATTGDFHVGETDALTIGTVVAGGNIVITNSAGNLTVGTVTAGGDATLTAAGSLVDDNNNSTRITADTAFLTALSGNIGAPGTVEQIDTDTKALVASAAGGSLYIGEAGSIFLSGISVTGTASVSTVTGDITVGALSAGQQVQLVSGGSILDDGSNATRIVTASLLMEALGGSIGGVGANAQIDTDVPVIAARANNGNINIGEANALTVQGMLAGGNIVVTNGGGASLTLAGPMVSAGGSILVHAADDIVMNSALSSVRAGGSGDVALWADGDFVQQGGTVRSAGGDVNISGQSVIQNLGATVATDFGTIFLTAYGAAPSGTMALNGTVAASAGNIVVSARSIGGVGDVAAGNTLVLNATTGNLTMSGLLRGNNVGLRARQNIGTPAQAVRVDANVLATSVDLGSVNVSEQNSVASGAVAVPLRTLSPFVPADMPGPNSALLSQQLRGGLTSANNLKFTSGGTLSGSSVSVGGDALMDIGGGYSGSALDVGGDADLTVNGDMEVDTIDIGGSFELQGGGDFIFDELTADDVLAEVDDDIGMGQVEAGDVEMNAGSISDNDSLINADNLILTAGGNIGSADAPINVEVGLLDQISGANVYLHHESASPVLVNLISASGNVTLSAPNSGIFDANDSGVGPVNFIAGDLLSLQAQQIGERTNPLEIQAGRFLQFVTPNDFETDIGFVWVLTTGTISGSEFGNAPEFDAARLPGLIIFNNQVVGGSDDVLREIFRTEAFVVETPELKSRQGIFGSPYFLHNYMNISEPVALGLIDYVLYGQAEVTADPEMPPEAKRGIVIGGGAVSSKIMPSYWQLPGTAKR